MNAYLSITRWPDGADEADKVRALATCAGLDPYSARLVVVRPLPLVVGRFDVTKCEAMVAALRAAGVGAHAPTREQFAAIKSAPRVKALHSALGAPEPMYNVECWDGRAAVLKSRHIVLLVRARLDSSTSSTTVSGPPRSGVFGAAGFGVGPAMIAGSLSGPTVDRRSTHKTSHVLDVYVKNGTRVRIDGDKFNFDVLGEAKSYSDLQNMDLLAARLAAEAPHAIIETGFKNFKCPADVMSDAFSAVGEASVHRRNDAGPFDFFSAWMYVLHKAEGNV